MAGKTGFPYGPLKQWHCLLYYPSPSIKSLKPFSLGNVPGAGLDRAVIGMCVCFCVCMSVFLRRKERR